MVCDIWRTNLNLNFKDRIIVQYAIDFFRPSTEALVLVLAFNFSLFGRSRKIFLELLQELPLFKTWNFFFSPDCQFLILLGQLCIEEAVAVEPCMQRTVQRIKVFDTCTLPPCAPQPHPTETEPSEGLADTGSLAQYQNKRGFSKCSRPTSVP